MNWSASWLSVPMATILFFGPIMIVLSIYATQIMSFFINKHRSCVEIVPPRSIKSVLTLPKKVLGTYLIRYKLFNSRIMLSN